MTRRRNQNLAPDEAAILRDIAAYHGYTQKSGAQAGEGSSFALTLAIVHGDVQTISLDEDELRRIGPWLAAQARSQSDPVLVDILDGLAAQLTARLATNDGNREGPTEVGPPSEINTLDG